MLTIGTIAGVQHLFHAFGQYLPLLAAIGRSEQDTTFTSGPAILGEQERAFCAYGYTIPVIDKGDGLQMFADATSLRRPMFAAVARHQNRAFDTGGPTASFVLEPDSVEMFFEAALLPLPANAV